MRLLLLIFGAWAAWKIAEENGLTEREPLLPARSTPLPARAAARSRKR
ncbi:hypothetical protein [Mesorhizobium sp. CAU 1741]